jgi:hypothetical protein
MSSVEFIEDNTITIPVLKGGVKKHGDLWDCTQSKYAQNNLFSKKIDGKYIEANTVEYFDYRLIHCKSTSDEIKIFNLSDEISLELVAGFMRPKESPDFETYSNKFYNSEHITCHYRKDTYHINALPNSKDILNNYAAQNIMEGNLKATHFVGGITLGIEVRADILLIQNESCHKTNKKQDLFSKLIFGPIDSKVKRRLKAFDIENGESYKKQINVFSNPSIKSKPGSFSEMFEVIERAESNIDQQEFHTVCGTKVVGVPIRFVLVPIKQLLVEVIFEKLYMRLPRDVLTNYYEMLVFIQNFQASSFIIKNMLKSNSSFQIILNNPNSKILKNIDEYEKNLKKTCFKLFEKSNKALKDYKMKKATAKDLVQAQKHFQISCNPIEIFEKIEEFIKLAEGI